ncbi:hypothetical protein FQN50_003576 [Emmonsiellopsis sp. PD_5]|nr:hypothetical protein FQN50_003576 [Emmonsiellopsis sp. PD_5]
MYPPDGGEGYGRLEWTPLNIAPVSKRPLGEATRQHSGQAAVDNIHWLISRLNQLEGLDVMVALEYCYENKVIADFIWEMERLGLIKRIEGGKLALFTQNGQHRDEHPPGFEPRYAEVKSGSLEDNTVYLRIPGLPDKEIQLSSCSRAEPETETEELGDGAWLVNYRHNIYFKIPDKYLRKDGWKERIGWDSLPVERIRMSPPRPSFLHRLASSFRGRS